MKVCVRDEFRENLLSTKVPVQFIFNLPKQIIKTRERAKKATDGSRTPEKVLLIENDNNIEIKVVNFEECSLLGAELH